MKVTKAVQLFGGGTGVDDLVALSDPDVHFFEDRWWMFLGCLRSENKINIFSASLPPGAPLDSDAWEVTTDPSNSRNAVPLVEQPEEGVWDEWIHTPNYVVGENPNTPGGPSTQERIYYTGSSGDGISVEERLFRIGVLERVGGTWTRREHPVVTGTLERPSVWEPKVRFYEGKWRMWYLNGPNEAGPNELPDYRIMYTESDDGITGWSEPKILFTEEENYFDAVVTESGSGYEMVVASAPNLYGTPGWPIRQGLWLLASDTPSGKRSDWTEEPVRILDVENGETWYAGGVYGPSLRYAEDDRDTLHVFFTGFIDPEDGFGLSVGRLEVPGGMTRSIMDEPRR